MQHTANVLSELTDSVKQLNKQSRTKIIKTIQAAIKNIQRIAPPQQNVKVSTTSGGGQSPQRVSPVAPPITTTTNPTAPATMKAKPRTHLRKTRNNTPGTAPAIITPPVQSGTTQRRSTRLNPTIVEPIILATSPNSNQIPMAHSHIIAEEEDTDPAENIPSMAPVGLGLPKQQQQKNRHPNIVEPIILVSSAKSVQIPMARFHIISQEAINLVTSTVYGDASNLWLTGKFITASPAAKPTNAHDADLEHYCAPVVYHVTGVTITQYKKLANDPVTSEIWKEHAFGKEFGRMAQCDARSGTKGKNCIFVMSHDETAQMRAKGKKPTYARVVVDFRPQKEDPN